MHDIERVKEDPAMERDYMDMQMKLMIAAEKGINEGIKKGIKTGINLGIAEASYKNAQNVARYERSHGLNKDQIADKLAKIFSKLSDDQLQQILADLK